jgi:molybdenum cofactor cytidylyltransferase
MHRGLAVKTKPVVVVLAAGSGSRFGSDRHKLDQPLAGASVLSITLRNALASELPVVVVTSEAMAPKVQQEVAARDIVVMAASSQPSGMGDSIAAGVAARAHESGWVILPGDMPLVQPATLQQVAAALDDHHPIAYAQHAGRRGHPVAFSAEMFSELVKLSGDEGARRLLARYPSHAVDVCDPGVLADIDTPDDLAAAQRAHDASSTVRS